ncbi:MAG: hypothetical protein EBT97_09535 [Actinobacteria bacterium]|nr:hypothetical protein [Actinomycetota bacterium]
MDPNACVNRILTALRQGDLEEAREASDDLSEWILRGGFRPEPTAYARLSAAAPESFLNELEGLLALLRPEESDDL